MRKLVSTACAAVLAAGLGASCGGETPGPGPTPPPVAGAAVLVGAGDIAVCGSAGTEGTAALLDGIEGTVFTAGDNAYFQGSMENFRDCYEPTWGRHKARTRPAPGNHDYETSGGGPYFAYFGSRAGPSGLGYYSFNLGAWHIVSLNSNVPAQVGTPQFTWLRDDLSSSSSRCLGAIWHHPLFSSGPNHIEPTMRDAWRLLQQQGAEFVINGHDHLYERFATTDDTGRPSPAGIRLFIVGTGGAQLYSFVRALPGSEARASVWGVLKLKLLADSYDWEFIAVDSKVMDSGSAGCH
jgi:acid phosphatase type 7